ncbi:PDZ domain-containing protein [Sphingomonas sabuli]|uniref:PDZ domain-containing protein n=1 Tax=Sphingomonas sabuli TaxID=2764186 RepID=A0A7G9L532_9SPHN|nr:PDZ domain-containing protein [Sphingomonas sabuli]QNM83731.1 PDZ domain-containing protein [Sphingomonas sabuli]
MRRFALAAAILAAASPTLSAAAEPAATAQAPTAADYAADAVAFDKIISDNYGYQDRWPGGVLPDSDALRTARAAVHDKRSLLHYVEDRLASLADHHAIAGSSFKDSWALVPTYSDVWVERQGKDFVITAVRPGSPAATAGIAAGDRLTAIGEQPVADAVEAYWAKLGLEVDAERAVYAAQVLAAGRRDRARDLTVARGSASRRLTLPSLYTVKLDRPPLSIATEAGGATVIRINNSLGDQATIAAFDAAMAALPPRAPVVIDIADTPSGGNTSIARAIMGWFVDRPRDYQVHRLPAEERQTGIPRQWVEQVLPRAGKHHAVLPTVRVGRWTGSMGEGLAIGFAALGAPVTGTPMARLRGAVYDFTLPASGLVVKLPVERLYSIDGRPREDFVPAALGEKTS